MDNISVNGRPIYQKGWSEEHKLPQKMVEVMKQVEYIQKKGVNKFHNYKYATEADVNAKVRQELSARNIIFLPAVVKREMRETTTRGGNTEYIICVDMEFTFMDAETGETLTVPMSGEGQDVGDKAIYKAISGTQKYGLMKTFMIETGDDPEQDERNPEQPQQGPQGPVTVSGGKQPPAPPPTNTGVAMITEGNLRRLNAKATDAGFKKEQKTDLMDAVSLILKRPILSLNEIKASEVEEVAKWLDKNKVNRQPEQKAN